MFSVPSTSGIVMIVQLSATIGQQATFEFSKLPFKTRLDAKPFL